MLKAAVQIYINRFSNQLLHLCLIDLETDYQIVQLCRAIFAAQKTQPDLLPVNLFDSGRQIQQTGAKDPGNLVI